MWKTKHAEHVLDKTLKEIRDAVKEAGKEMTVRLDAIIANQNRRHATKPGRV